MDHFISFGIMLIIISICMLVAWFKARYEGRKLNYDNWYSSIIQTFEKGCWIKEKGAESRKYKVLGVDETAGEVHLDLYIFNPNSGVYERIRTEMWTLEYVMSELYNNEIIIIKE